MSTPQSDTRDTWNATAAGWAKWEATVADVVAGPTDEMFRIAAIEPGMRVLDIACGAGSQTLSLARRVGANGHVLATDISSVMLKHVRKQADDAGLNNIEVKEASADALNVGSGFDAAVCRLGLMLFPDPVKAARAAHDALGRGAHYSALVFTTPDRNTAFAETLRIVLDFAGAPPPPPDAPGLFALGAEGVLEAVLEDAGFEVFESRPMGVTLELPDAATALDFFRESAGVLKAILSRADDATQDSAWRAVKENLNRYVADNRFVAQLEFKVGGGRRPA